MTKFRGKARHCDSADHKAGCGAGADNRHHLGAGLIEDLEQHGRRDAGFGAQHGHSHHRQGAP